MEVLKGSVSSLKYGVEATRADQVLLATTLSLPHTQPKQDCFLEIEIVEAIKRIETGIHDN